MNRHAETGSVSGISIAIPLALLVALSGAVAVKAGFASSGQRDAPVTAPEVVTVQPHSFEYREATEYFRKGLAVDAPKRAAKVRLPLDVMKFQTSRAEYERCVLDGACAPAEYEGNAETDVPVTGVSYDDAVQYASWLSERTGENWRLPTDFELAYAADDRFPDDALGIDADDTNPATRWLADYEREARRAASTNPKPQPRGSFGISTTGLVDFAGNVWEWTSTCNRRVDLDKAAEAGTLDPTNCGIIIASGKHRSPMSSFVRNPKGGGCAVGAPPDNLGFRLVRRPTFLQSVVAFAHRAATDALGPHISAQTEQNENEG